MLPMVWRSAPDVSSHPGQPSQTFARPEDSILMVGSPACDGAPSPPAVRLGKDAEGGARRSARAGSVLKRCRWFDEVRPT
jgi:hypothetical protein